MNSPVGETGHARKQVPVSVVVLTKNEEQLIARCLSCTTWAKEVLVVDSGSSDRTQDIARELGARVVHQPWLGYSAQRNAGARMAAFDWVLQLDVDELISDEMVESVRALFAKSNPCPDDGFAVNRRGDFLGKLLSNPSRPEKRLRAVRLYNRNRTHFDEAVRVHEEAVVPGTRHMLQGTLIHWRGSTISEYVSSFNRYAVLEAEEMNAKGRVGSVRLCLVRPVSRFAWLYLGKGGWKMGPQGFISAGLKAFNELARYMNLMELQGGACTANADFPWLSSSEPVESTDSAGATRTHECVRAIAEQALRRGEDLFSHGATSGMVRLLCKPGLRLVINLVRFSSRRPGSSRTVVALCGALCSTFLTEARLWELRYCPNHEHPPEEVYPASRYPSGYEFQSVGGSGAALLNNECE